MRLFSRHRCLLSALALICSLQADMSANAETLIIDDFTTVQGLPSGSNRGAVSGGGILGTERDIIFGVVGGGQTFAIGGGQLIQNMPGSAPSNFSLDYDGIQGGNGSPDRAGQLPPIDLTQGGTNNAIVIPVLGIAGEWRVNIRIDSGLSVSRIQTQFVSAPTNLHFMLSEFTGAGDLTQANSILINFRTEAGPAGITLGEISVLNVPEPSTLALGGCGALGLIFAARRRILRRATTVACLLVCAACLISPEAASAITIPTVPVGNAGNAPDPLTGYGSVSYDYRIGTTEVTNAQYAAFLNAKAASDPLGLYHENMGSDPRGGIARSGSSGNYTYAPKANMGNKPVSHVSWYDAIRFANWLHNGQGTGDTETGAYTLLGDTTWPSNGNSITRNPGAKWWLPSEDEWYKAAYHQPAAQGGDSDDYWLYPTASNTAPTVATANSVGDISNPGYNVANFNFGADWVSHGSNVTTVGSAGSASDSFYGTADQGGNVWEWNEALVFQTNRGIRGGAWNTNLSYFLHANSRHHTYPGDEYNAGIGFRVATVPEPSTAVLAIFGCALMLWWSKRQK